MEVFCTRSSGQGNLLNPACGGDPRLQATPDCGSLGPGSDISAGPPDAPSASTRRGATVARPLFAVAVGVLLAVLVAGVGSAHSTWSNFGNSFSLVSHPDENLASARDFGQLDQMKPQKQAETLLELAVGRSNGAVEQISSRVDRWQGKLHWDSQIATLSTAALNSNDMRVRESGVEVELAAYGLARNSVSLDYVLKSADSPDHAQKIWALWALGLLGNRGVETGRVVAVLSSRLKDSDEDSRRWAVEGLALAGTAQSIPILLEVMHDDPSASIRELAAYSLAESGMFTPEQRMSAVPQLVNYSDDSSLDAQTHAWAFQALGDITHQRLPSHSAAWRSWYENRSQ
jgi:HEAT repeat protein